MTLPKSRRQFESVIPHIWFIMEEKLDLIIQKLDELLVLTKRIHRDTEPSIENNTSEYLLNVLGDVTGDVIMQGLTGSR